MATHLSVLGVKNMAISIANFSLFLYFLIIIGPRLVQCYSYDNRMAAPDFFMDRR